MKATKFGLYEIGPMSVDTVRERRQNRGEDYYDTIKNTQVRIYYGENNHYVKTSIDRPFPNDDYALYDSETERIYTVEFDDLNMHEYNLDAVGTKSIQKVDSNELKNQIYQRYTPLIRINRTRS